MLLGSLLVESLTGRFDPFRKHRQQTRCFPSGLATCVHTPEISAFFLKDYSYCRIEYYSHKLAQWASLNEVKTSSMYIKSNAEQQASGSHQPKERRSIARRHLIYYLRTWDMTNNRLLGHVVDINTGGFMLISEEPIAAGSEYRLEVRLPNPQGDLQAMRFRAICRWNNNNINKPFFDSGFEIQQKDSDAIHTIQQMINDYGFGGG
jgi:hypothetical protein